MKFPGIFKTTLKILIPLVIGLLILWLLYRDMDFNQLWHTLREGSDFGILLGSLLFGLAANIIRGLRWDLLIRSLGESPKRSHSILTVLGNYAVNMALPRMGEVWRCAAMSHYSGIGFSRLFGTLLIDRVFDLVMVAILVALACFGNMDFFLDFFRDNPEFPHRIQALLSSPWFYVSLAALALIVYMVWRLGKQSKYIRKVHSFGQNVWQGLRVIGTMDQKWLFILYSILLWVGYFLYFYTTFYAFDFTAHLGPGIGLVTFIMSSIAVAAPVQAGMGAWHFMVIYTLTTFGVGRDDAASFALIVHTIQTLWITLTGLVAIAILTAYGKRSRAK